MIIAGQKKKENIVEYILYMWHIEDLLRANEFDMERIQMNVIARFEQPDDVLQQMTIWYRKLIDSMKEEEVLQGGHLVFLVEQVHQLNDMHLNLINDLNEQQYSQAYHMAQPYIAELKRKSAQGSTEIEVCLNALYMLMMIRIKGVTPFGETVTALETFSNLLALLSAWYKNNTVQAFDLS